LLLVLTDRFAVRFRYHQWRCLQPPMKHPYNTDEASYSKRLESVRKDAECAVLLCLSVCLSLFVSLSLSFSLSQQTPHSSPQKNTGTFGTIKGRFRVLIKPFCVQDWRIIEKIFRSACCLHNMLLDHDGLASIGKQSTDWVAAKDLKERATLDAVRIARDRSDGTKLRVPGGCGPHLFHPPACPPNLNTCCYLLTDNGC
jgi:hypothetical protein